MLQFGLSAVQGGKRVIAGNNEPTLIANSGKAKFTLAAPVTRIMGLMPGDSIQFISTVAAIDAAIAERDADVVSWCEANGVEFGTEAAHAALLEEFAEYYIAKGIALYEKDGSPKLATIRMTAEEKAVSFELNKEAIAEQLGKPVEELKLEDYKPTTHAFSGSKLSTSSNLTGIGLQLTFSDSNVWAELKENLGDDAEKINRVFNVDLEKPTTVEIENGKVNGEEKEVVQVTAYKLVFKADEESNVRGAKQD